MAWIRKSKSGESYHVLWRDPAGEEKCRTFRLKTEARDFAKDVDSDMRRGAYQDPALGRIPLSRFWERFLEASPHLAPKTRVWYEMLARRYILPALGSKRLATITRMDVEGLLASLEARGIGAPTIAGTYRVLRAVLAKAEADGRLVRNPTRGVSVPRAATREQRVLTLEELERVADAAPARYRALVLLLGYCGLRIGEAAALRVQDVDFLRRSLSVTRASSEVGSRLVVGPTKTRRSRAVSIPVSVVEELARHVQAFPPGADGLMFTNGQGRSIRQSNFNRKVWQPAVERAKLAEPLPRVHDLRHTASALSVSVGAHGKEIQALLGHSSIEMTLGTYGHLFPGASERLAGRLDEARLAVLRKDAEQMRNDEASNEGAT